MSWLLLFKQVVYIISGGSALFALVAAVVDEEPMILFVFGIPALAIGWVLPLALTFLVGQHKK